MSTRPSSELRSRRGPRCGTARRHDRSRASRGVLIADGEKLTQTAPILLDLAKKFGRFGGSTEAERFEILRWLFWDNQKLSSFMATYRYMRAFTPSPDAQVLKYLKRRLDDFLSIVENRLAEQP